jgi:hypothetical protein
MSAWTIEIEGEDFLRFTRSLSAYEQAVMAAALDHVLAVRGIDVCAGEWGKALGGRRYEFRIRKTLDTMLGEVGIEPSGRRDGDRRVLLRIFCTFHGRRIVLLLHGYDKLRDPSAKRQQREIARARRLLKDWRRRKRS